jgi:hypothetical protein
MRRFSTFIVAGLLALMATGAQANLITFSGTLAGTNEVPPNGSGATGFVTIDVDTTLHLLSVDLSWGGLVGGNPMAAHIHCCIAPGSNVGVAVGFPSCPATPSGTYQHTFDLTDPTIYTLGFLNNFGGGTAAGAEAALIAGLVAHLAYVNIHNVQFPGGEIRSQVALVAEPMSLALFAVALGAAGYARRRQLPRCT